MTAPRKAPAPHHPAAGLDPAAGAARRRPVRWLSRTEAAVYVGPRRSGRPTSAETIGDWQLRGLRGVYLRYVLRGAQYMTRAKWIREFFSELRRVRDEARQAAAARVPAAATPRKQAALERRYEAANERNRQAGIA